MGCEGEGEVCMCDKHTSCNIRCVILPPSSPYQRLQAVLNVLYHPTAPRLAHSKASAPPSGHDVWCELTWGHALLTLQEWAAHLKGLQVGGPMWLHYN